MEILDVFKDINSQVVGRQNKQIQAFPESLLPKTQRDMGAEVNTDKAVERINQVLETKLGALEFLVQQFASGPGIDPMFMVKKDVRLPGRQAEDIITNTGDVVPLWNGVVRLYQQQGLSRDSQNTIKVQVQELTPNLEAIVYGMNSALDYIFRQRVMNASLMLMVMEFLRTLSVYTVIKQQVDSGQFELLSVEALHRTYKNLLEEQTSERQALIKKYAPRGDITSTPIRNIPDFDVFGRQERLKAVAEELGIDPRVFASANIGSMTGTQFNQFLAKIDGEKQAFRAGFSRQEEALLQEAQDKMDRIQAYEIFNQESDERVRQYQELIRQLETEAPLELAEVERLTEEVPDEPIIPDTPDRVEFPSGEGGDEAYEEAMRAYREEMIPVEIARETREAIIERNEGLLARLEKNQATRKQTILDRQRRIRSNQVNKEKRTALIRQIEASLPDIEERARKLREGKPLARSVRSILESYTKPVSARAMRDENLAQSTEFLRAEALRRNPPPRRPVVKPGVARPSVARPEIGSLDDEKEAPAEPSGEGRKAETRGLASLRKNYGFESMSDTDDSEEEEEEEDDRPFDFDDAGNDMYYSRPMR